MRTATSSSKVRAKGTLGRAWMAVAGLVLAATMALVPTTKALAYNTGTLGLTNTWDSYYRAEGATDEFTLTVPRPGKVEVYLWTTFRYTNAELFDKDGTTKFLDLGDPSGTTQSPSTTSGWNWLDKGTYTLKVWGGYSEDTGTYKIKARYADAKTTEVEPNDDFSQARTLSAGATVRGLIDYTGQNQALDYDFYKITVPYRQKVTFRLSRLTVDGNHAGKMDLCFFDHDCVDLYDFNRPADYNYSSGDPTTVATMTLSAGTYYVRVGGYDWYYTGPYSFSWSLAPKPKKANTLKVSPAKKAISVKVAKKHGKSKVAKTVSASIRVSAAQGKVSFSKVGGSSRLKVNASNGLITVKKGTKKGAYTVKIKVRAAGNGTYAAGNRTVTRTVKVK